MKQHSRWSMLALSPLPDFVRAIFRATFELTEVTLPLTASACSGAPQVLLTTVTVPLRDQDIQALPPSIRAVATYSVGLDHIELPRLRERGIAVFNTPDVLTESVADNAMLHVLATLRRATESIQLVRSRQWSGWTPLQLLGREAAGQQLGIFGMGRIGRAVARRARAFGMVVHYCNRRRLAPVEEEGALFHSDVAHFLASIDVLILAAPSNDSTRHFLDSARIACLRRGSIIVNIARGDLVHDDALIAALESGQVGAAGLDVFEGEPALDPRYLTLDNVFLTPHIGSSTVEARRRMAEVLVSGIEQWRRGGTPHNRVA